MLADSRGCAGVKDVARATSFSKFSQRGCADSGFNSTRLDGLANARAAAVLDETQVGRRFLWRAAGFAGTAGPVVAGGANHAGSMSFGRIAVSESAPRHPAAATD
jgi:hypothetical protein